MNNTQLGPGLSAMLEGTNSSIDPSALLQQQQQSLLEIGTSSLCTTSSSSVQRLPTRDTEEDIDDDFEEGDEKVKKHNTRGKNRMPGAFSKTKSTSRSATKSKRGAATTGTADKRRKRNLERNRAAASKCRKRQKQWQDGLERKKTELESRFKALHSENKELIEEIAQLKNFIMAHAACNNANIDDWIRNEADKFVRLRSKAQAQVYPVSAPSVSAATGPMAQILSSAEGTRALDLPTNEPWNNMFATSISNAPFNATTKTDDNLRPGAAYTTQQSKISFDQDLLMVSPMHG